MDRAKGKSPAKAAALQHRKAHQLMGTAEDIYREALAAILYPKGSPQRAEAKRELQLQLEADVFLRDGGTPRAVYRAQQAFAVEYYRLVESFYNGELEESHYRGLRIAALGLYASRLFRLGLVSQVFDRAWVQAFADRSLAHERELLPVPREFTGWTEEDSALLCDSLRDFSKEFFRAVHMEFGVGRLKDRPAIYGGVDGSLIRQEEQPREAVSGLRE